MAETQKPTSDGTVPVFRVQVGAYSNVVQAIRCLSKLKKAGYGGIVLKCDNRLYRVQTGTFTDIVEAQNHDAGLRAQKFRSFITMSGGEEVSGELVDAVMHSCGVQPQKLDKVRVAEGAPIYGTAAQFPDWVYHVELFVRYVDGDCVTVSTVATGPVLGNVHKQYLTEA